MRSAGLNVIDVNAGSKTNHPEDFVMLRDELWWSFRDRFRDQSLSFHPDCKSTEIALLRGQVSALFLVGYGLARFGSEFFRTPDAGIFGQSDVISMGQWLSLPMIVIGLALFYLFGRRKAA
jgi:hypothetical protein